jgi:hypothetical protein
MDSKEERVLREKPALLVTQALKESLELLRILVLLVPQEKQALLVIQVQQVMVKRVPRAPLEKRALLEQLLL